MSRGRTTLIWVLLATIVVVPIAAATTSPLLAWREPIYIAAGFAGIIAMTLLLIQPLLAGRYLPGLSPLQSRHLHGWVGSLLVLAVLVHVVGLWITSPPDVIDVLLFRSPTPFSVWGVIAMWAVFAAALLAIFRRRLNLRLQKWRFAHTLLATIVIIGSVVHALLIEGTMETITKIGLCVLVIAAAARVFMKLRVWNIRLRVKN